MHHINKTKKWLGDILGDFSCSLGDFFTKTSGQPDFMECRGSFLILPLGLNFDPRDEVVPQE
jgi:hypothetical protein